MAKTNQITVESNESEAVAAQPQFELPKLMETHKTKSNVIRFLSSQGWTRSQIASFMSIRYQHVRNVLIQPLKQKTEPVTEPTKPAEAE